MRQILSLKSFQKKVYCCADSGRENKFFQTFHVSSSSFVDGGGLADDSPV